MAKHNVQSSASAPKLYPIVDHASRGNTQRSYSVVSAGTAGTNKALTFIDLMIKSGRDGKIQSFTGGDWNTNTQKNLKELPSRIHVIQPIFIPQGLAYNRNPNGWQNDKLIRPTRHGLSYGFQSSGAK